MQQPKQQDSSKDPRQAEPSPPFPQGKTQPPGKETEMRPQADHGEKTYRGCNRLAGKAAIITGADSGIGRAVALAFAREGADVLIAYLNEHEDARETARLVEEAGRRSVLAAGDVADESHCRGLVQRAGDEFGRLDILVNNAAHQRTYAHISELPADDWDRTFRTNIYAMFYLCKAAVEHMPACGSIINTTSIQAYQPSPELLAYAPTKGAIVTFSKALAKMLMKQGIRVNAIAPGPVWTPLIPSTMPEQKVEQFGGQSVFERPAQPAELAPVFVLLASDEASYITGEVYGITGGMFPL